MRQNITLEQLNELSDKGKERLRDWWKKKEIRDTVIISRINTEHNTIDGKVYMDIHGWILPLLSIGQMIEFLYDKKKYEPFTEFVLDDSIFFICDDLWEKVKEVLEQ